MKSVQFLQCNIPILLSAGWSTLLVSSVGRGIERFLWNEGRVVLKRGPQTFFQKAKCALDLPQNLRFLLFAQVGVIFDDRSAGNGGSYSLLKRLVAAEYIL